MRYRIPALVVAFTVTLVTSISRSDPPAANRNGVLLDFRQKLALSASSSYPGWEPANAFDGQPGTSWFSNNDDSAAKGAKPWIQLSFPDDVTIHRVTVLGNREANWPRGYSILAGRLDVLDRDGHVLHSVTNEAAGELRDFDFPLDAPIDRARTIRFTSLGDQGNDNPYGDIAIAEIQVD